MHYQHITVRLIEELSDSPTALICNACSFMELHAPCTDWNIRYLTPEFPPMCGIAITIRLDCSTPEDQLPPDTSGELYYEMIDRIQNSLFPMVVVIKSMGEKSRGAVAGDGMAKTMLAAGASGLVTDGGIRDLEGIRHAGLKTFGGGLTVNHRALRWSGLGEPVTIGSLEIHSGDLLHGDGDGIITVPEKSWNRIVGACNYVNDFEKKAHALLRRSDIPGKEKYLRVSELSEACRDRIRSAQNENHTV